MGKEVIAQLREQVTVNTSVNGSATALINGFKDQLKAAVAAALENGATAEELAPITQLNTDLSNSSTELAAAVAANTPGGPVVPPTDPEAGRRR